MSKKAGKARKAAKAQRAAKHRGQGKQRREHKREARKQEVKALPSTAPPPPPAQVSPAANAVFEFCKRYRLEPFHVMHTLMQEHEPPWVLEGHEKKHEIDAATRQEVLVRLRAACVRLTPPRGAGEGRSRGGISIAAGTPQDCL